MPSWLTATTCSRWTCPTAGRGGRRSASCNEKGRPKAPLFISFFLPSDARKAAQAFQVEHGHAARLDTQNARVLQSAQRHVDTLARHTAQQADLLLSQI